MSGRTDLYRYFDRDGRLLYVGISFSAVARAAQHRDDKSWWVDVARMDVEHLPSRQAALDAERTAIQTENPIHNVIHNRSATTSVSSPADHRPEEPSDPLSDKYILSAPDDGDFPRVNLQGRVMGLVGDGVYLVQLYSWVTGNANGCQLFTITDMARWKFYETHQEWLDAGETGMRANDRWFDQHYKAGAT